MKRSFAAALMVLLLAAAMLPGLHAQSFRVPFTQFQLDNGLRVVLSVDTAAPVVAVALYYDVGSRNEAKGRTGFAHLFEHMMFQGSENVGKGEHFKFVENNGGYLNGSTHVDFTEYYEFLPSNQLELALWLESDRMRSLKITPANLQNQKDAVKEEKRLSYDNQAYAPALEKMDEMVFYNWANSHSTIGSMADLDAATVADVQKFFDTYYVPNNAVLAIAGDIDPQQAETLVRKYFAAIPRGGVPPPVDVSEAAGTVAHHSVVEDPHADTPAIAIAWKTPDRRAPDSYAIALLKAILFDGDSSRLYQVLVKREAAALEVSGTLEERRGPGQLAVFVVHKPEVKDQQVQTIIDAEIDKLKLKGVSADELSKAKNQFRLSRFVNPAEGEQVTLQTALGRAMALAEFALFDGDPSEINSELDRYLAVTPEQVREVARKLFVDPNKAVLFIHSPKQK